MRISFCILAVTGLLTACAADDETAADAGYGGSGSGGQVGGGNGDGANGEGGQVIGGVPVGGGSGGLLLIGGNGGDGGGDGGALPIGGDGGAGGLPIGGAGGELPLGGEGGGLGGTGGFGAEGGAGGGGGAGGEEPPFVTQDDVQAIFNQSCSCHTMGMSGGMSLADPFTDNTVGIPANGGPLNRIEPGDSQASYIFHKVSGTAGAVGGGGAQMPLGGAPLSDEDIVTIATWIDSL